MPVNRMVSAIEEEIESLSPESDHTEISSVTAKIAKLPTAALQNKLAVKLAYKTKQQITDVKQDIRTIKEGGGTHGKPIGYFPGLIDICLNAENKTAFLQIDDTGHPVLSESCEVNGEIVSPPGAHHFQFKLPRAEEVMRLCYEDDQTLWNDIDGFIGNHVYLDDGQRALLTAYVLLTYLHDHREIYYCPIIMLFAAPERGKSRAGRCLTYICFRGLHLIDLREANIIRYADHQHAMLFFDLKDIMKKAAMTNCEDLLLLRYEKGAKAGRVLFPDQGPFQDMKHFDIYGPTLIASNQPPDHILGSRCVSINMPNKPGAYANPKPQDGLELKERMTAFRAAHLNESLTDIDPLPGLEGRLWDITKPLFQMCLLAHPESLGLLHKTILGVAGEQTESRKQTYEGRIVGIIKELSDRNGLNGQSSWHIDTADITRTYNSNLNPQHQVSAQFIGVKVKSLSLTTRKVKGFSQVLLDQEGFRKLLTQYGYLEVPVTPATAIQVPLPLSSNSTSEPPPEQSLPDSQPKIE
jgi:hypothetical protein